MASPVDRSRPEAPSEAVPPTTLKNDRQYGDTNWWLVRGTQGGHMVSGYWTPEWRGQGRPDETTKPPHGENVDGVPVLYPHSAAEGIRNFGGGGQHMNWPMGTTPGLQATTSPPRGEVKGHMDFP